MSVLSATATKEYCMELGNALPSPVLDKPEYRERRLITAVETFVALRPGDAYEARLAVRIVLCGAHAMESLRLADVNRADFAKTTRCRAQAASMMRAESSAKRALEREQKVRLAAEAVAGAVGAANGARAEGAPAPPPQAEPQAPPQVQAAAVAAVQAAVASSVQAVAASSVRAATSPASSQTAEAASPPSVQTTAAASRSVQIPAAASPSVQTPAAASPPAQAAAAASPLAQKAEAAAPPAAAQLAVAPPRPAVTQVTPAHVRSGSAPPPSPEAITKAEFFAINAVMAAARIRRDGGVTPQSQAFFPRVRLPTDPAVIDALVRGTSAPLRVLDGIGRKMPEAAD